MCKTKHIFVLCLTRATQVLVGLLFLINGAEFAFFLASEINRPEMQAETRARAQALT